MRSLCSRALAAAAPFVLVSSTFAQWSSDPTQNLAIADRTGEQTQVKLAPTADGGTYVSWFDNSGGGYDAYLQKLDAQGNELWKHNGVLLADRMFSSTQDYDLDTDTEDNALIVFRDDRFGGVKATAAKIMADGTLAWGPNGVQVNATGGANQPKIAGTSDGAAVVAWSDSGSVFMQKLDGEGAPQWAMPTQLTIATGFAPSDLDASDNGSVIISLVRGFLSATYYAQKIDANGAQVWNAGAPLQLSTNFLQIANFPQFVTDGAGGGVFAWYNTGPLQVYAQRVNAAGTQLWAANGVPVSTNAAQLRVSPTVSYDADAEETSVFWIELNGTQSMHGVYGQKFDAMGARQWTDNGAIIEALSSMERLLIQSTQTDNGAAVTWLETVAPVTHTLEAALVEPDGSFDSIIPISTVSSGKGRLAIDRSANGFSIIAWADNRTDSNDIYVQNLNDDGSLGTVSIPGDLDGNGVINLFDLLDLLAEWGPCADPCPPSCPADIADDDCTVNVFDLLQLLANWG